MSENRAIKRLLKNMENIRTHVLMFGESTPITEICTKQALLNEQWKEYQSLEKNMKGKFDDSNIEALDRIETINFELQEKIFKWLKIHEISNRDRGNDSLDELALNQSNFLKEISNINRRDMRLPSVNIPTFSGIYSEFPSFSDLFETSIHYNERISKVYKMQYLKGLLKGEAYTLINHLSVTEANYDEAWDKIKKRYNKPKHIIQTLLKQFMDQASIQQSCPKSLRQLAEVSDEVIRGLKVLGEQAESRDPWIIYILVNKLDSDSREAWAHETAENNFPSLIEFCTFLNKRSDALESFSSMSRGRTNPKRITSMISQVPLSCPLCSGDHYLGRCEKYVALAISARRQIVAENKLCFNCLSSNHQASICRSKYNCRMCRRRHHVTLHPEDQDEIKVEDSDETSLNACTQPVNNHICAILPTALITVKDQFGRPQRCRALLDSGSQSSFISEDCIQRLRLPRTRANIKIKGITIGEVSTKGKGTIIMGSLYNPRVQIELEALVLNKLPMKVPGHNIEIEELPSLNDVQLADPNFYKATPIDILIGADKFFEILERDRMQLMSISLQNTVFGWVVSGRPTSADKSERRPWNSAGATCEENDMILQTLSIQLDVDIDKTLRQFWELEERPRLNKMSPEEEKCANFYTDTLRRSDNGRYIVRLPFREISPNLGNSVIVATKRFLALERKLARDKKLRDQYTEQVKEYIQLGHMVEIPNEEVNTNLPLFYLPHHAVTKDTSETTKVRVVFDGSSKTTNGTSLNDILMVGPNIQPNLWTTLLRFRCHRIAITADIERMYRQVLVSNQDTDYQRLLWRGDSSEKIRHYKLTTVTFGLACSAYLAIRTLQQTALEHGDANISNHTMQDFYVDDFLSGAENEMMAKQLKHNITNTLQKGGFELRKWKSNLSSLSEEIPCQPAIKLGGELAPVRTILGLHWHSYKDKFTFRIHMEPAGPITKRRIISEASRVFDPLGFLSPSTILLKILFQKLWLSKFGWDDQVPEHYQVEYKKIRDEFKYFEEIEIQRFTNHYGKLEIHGFADASERAYSAVIYSKIVDEKGQIAINLLTAKTKVAPIKKVSLPRLELCAAHLLAKLMHAVKETLTPGIKYYAWTDSSIVLAWLSTYPAKWKTFVANRTSDILDKFPRQHWFHVRSSDNPADHGSRGVSPERLVNLRQWWCGPEWLSQPLIVRSSQEEASSEENISEIERESSKNGLTEYALQITVHGDWLGTLFERKSNLHQILRIIAYVKRYIANLKYRHSKLRNLCELTAKEFEEAIITCVNWVQSNRFKEDIANLRKYQMVNNKSRLLSLAPFVDATGILRVGGRLDNADCNYNSRHPIILPPDHVYTERLIEKIHRDNLHAGPTLTGSLLRQKYWIVNGRNKIRLLLKGCVICSKYASRVSNQLMGSLPTERVTPTRPFTNCGIDFAGPIYLASKRGRGVTKPIKGYLCIFVCLSVKAVHVEPVSDLTSEAFLAALKRFTSRRGVPAKIYTDNGSNFIGARRILEDAHKMIKNINQNNLISVFLSQNNIEWHFIPPASPHMGGLWESAVKSVKTHLLKSTANVNLTFEEIATLLCQIETILNSRPLFSTSSDENYEVLTPAHFLIGNIAEAVPEPQIEFKSDVLLSRWQRIQKRVQIFWKKYSLEYLNTLQQRYKWKKPKENLKINDIVLIKEDYIPVCRWPLGRVIQVHPGEDQIVRVVTIKTKSATLQRPVVKLCKLPIV